MAQSLRADCRLPAKIHKMFMQGLSGRNKMEHAEPHLYSEKTRWDVVAQFIFKETLGLEV
jgi:hypothetical protein